MWLEALTENDLEDRYDSSQSRAVPEMPNQEERWCLRKNTGRKATGNHLPTIPKNMASQITGITSSSCRSCNSNSSISRSSNISSDRSNSTLGR